MLKLDTNGFRFLGVWIVVGELIANERFGVYRFLLSFYLITACYEVNSAMLTLGSERTLFVSSLSYQVIPNWSID